MKLNQHRPAVTDIEAVRRFFETHFELRSIFTREDGLTVLLDDNGLALTSELPATSRATYLPNGVSRRPFCRINS